VSIPRTTGGSTCKRRRRLRTCTQLERHRQQSHDRRQSRHQDWAHANACRFHDRAAQILSAVAALVGEIDQQDRIGHNDSDHRDDPHEGFDVKRGAGKEQRPDDPDQSHRHRKHDDERVEKRAELRDHYEVEQDHRKQQAVSEALKGFLHRFDRTSNGYPRWW
jgi:hypothetical protein